MVSLYTTKHDVEKGRLDKVILQQVKALVKIASPKYSFERLRINISVTSYDDKQW